MDTNMIVFSEIMPPLLGISVTLRPLIHHGITGMFAASAALWIATTL
jgi:hypothetical protein